MKKVGKKELEQGNAQLKELVTFCKRYDDPFTLDFESEELKEALNEFKRKVSALPDLYFKMDTTFRYPTRGLLRDVDFTTFTSYYVMRIPEIYSLYKNKGYGTFFHEMREFLEDEILGVEWGDDAKKIALPVDVKNAIIDLIERIEQKEALL